MKKKLFALLTAGMMLLSGTAVYGSAYTEKQQRIADALYHVDLFRGTNNGYDLDKELTRVQGITLLVRMLGKEEAAMSEEYNLPFTDVDEWAECYVGYAYENGITNGVSATEFGSNKTMTDYMFITLTLRALGYTDQGEIPQFVWNKPYALANTVGLIETDEADTSFTRGDAIEVFWNALSRNDYQMAYSLRDRGVFTTEELEVAIEIYLHGKTDTEDTTGSVVIVGTSDSSKEADPDVELPFISNENDFGSALKPSLSDDKEDSAGSSNSGTSRTPDNEDKKTESDKTEDKTQTPSETPGASDNEMPKVPYEPEGPITYDKYIAMSGEAQQAYFESFENTADFFTWLNTAKAEYEKLNPSIEIGSDGSIDIGDIIDKENNG